jgi:hypothetical protein
MVTIHITLFSLFTLANITVIFNEIGQAICITFDILMMLFFAFLFYKFNGGRLVHSEETSLLSYLRVKKSYEYQMTSKSHQFDAYKTYR